MPHPRRQHSNPKVEISVAGTLVKPAVSYYTILSDQFPLGSGEHRKISDFCGQELIVSLTLKYNECINLSVSEA